MRILLVEDQDSIRHMIETLVQASGHEVRSVASGDDAVEVALKERFDIVLLDLMLPGGLDGIGVVKRLRADEATKKTPVFVLSAMDDAETQRRVLEAGATAFYAKPFRPLELLSHIKRAAAKT
ncbi:MAG TPA: response regulator [Byssovorax sp.]|jgi:DNA-binding response OmpR family regulator